jgi:hypothetical protein
MSRSTNQEAFPLLETKRLVLRQMRPGDAEAIFRIYGDEEVMRYRDVLPFTRPEEAQQFLEGVHACFGDPCSSDSTREEIRAVLLVKDARERVVPLRQC